MIRLYCSFPDKETALSIAQGLTGAEEKPESFPSDGWLNGIYYNIDVIFGTGEIPDVPGYHINGLWHGPKETVPEALSTFRVYPETPVCVFG